MPGKFEIMRAVQDGLNSIRVDKSVESDEVWTKAVKTELCNIGQDRFGCYVCAGGVDKADHGEWLYDVTWLEYEKNGPSEGKVRRKLVDAPLAAECEWDNLGEIYDDFEKLLLARTGVRLMIFHGWLKHGGPQGIAEQLAGRVREFNGSHPEDAWLLAGWEKSNDEEKGGPFRYFTIEANQAVPFPPPSGG